MLATGRGTSRARGAILSGSLLLALVGTIALTVSCDAGDDGSGGSATGADWVLTGGDIVTMDDGNPSATAVAIEDGELTYVGDDAGAAVFVSGATRTVDLAGRLVIPGLIDGHTHPGYIDLEDYDGPSAVPAARSSSNRCATTSKAIRGRGGSDFAAGPTGCSSTVPTGRTDATSTASLQTGQCGSAAAPGTATG